MTPPVALSAPTPETSGVVPQPGPPHGGASPRGWLVEPARPDWVRRHPHAPYYALAAVCIGAFMGQLDASIVTVAFPTFKRVFGASTGAVTWVGLSYLIVVVAGVTAVGRYADMVGRKLLYTYGFGVFVIGSGLCAIAPNLPALDAFRALQAVGAVMLQANSVAIVYLAMPKHRVVHGIGIQGAAQALGLALGPTIGGLLLAAGGWRLIFLVNVPAGLIGLLAARMLVPRSRELQARAPYDWRGLALFVPAVAAVLVAVSFGSHWGWVSPGPLGLFGGAVALSSAFVVHERRADAPMLDPALFRRRPFSAGVASGMLSYLVLFGVMFAVPFLLEQGARTSASRAGLILSILPLSLGAAAVLAGRLVDRAGSRWLAPAAMASVAAALGLLGAFHPTGAGLDAGLAVIGAGLGLFTPANNTAIMQSVPRSQSGVASGVLAMTRGLGTSLGLALGGLVLGAAAGSAAGASIGFGRVGLLLAGAAGLAAALSGLRGRAGPGEAGPA
ncbi:MAG: MFS transporter [Acidimicrobiales bacterium]